MCAAWPLAVGSIRTAAATATSTGTHLSHWRSRSWKDDTWARHPERDYEQRRAQGRIRSKELLVDGLKEAERESSLQSSEVDGIAVIELRAASGFRIHKQPPTPLLFATDPAHEPSRSPSCPISDDKKREVSSASGPHRNLTI